MTKWTVNRGLIVSVAGSKRKDVGLLHQIVIQGHGSTPLYRYWRPVCLDISLNIFSSPPGHQKGRLIMLGKQGLLRLTRES
jgi:hypothetical protein